MKKDDIQYLSAWPMPPTKFIDNQELVIHEVSRSNTQLLHNHVQHNKHFVSPNTHIVIEYYTCSLAI